MCSSANLERYYLLGLLDINYKQGLIENTYIQDSTILVSMAMLYWKVNDILGLVGKYFLQSRKSI